MLSKIRMPTTPGLGWTGHTRCPLKELAQGSPWLSGSAHALQQTLLKFALGFFTGFFTP